MNLTTAFQYDKDGKMIGLIIYKDGKNMQLTRDEALKLHGEIKALRGALGMFISKMD